ncbi:hypothetical protein LCGC14_2227400, partial [marine sediment metagenome]
MWKLIFSLSVALVTAAWSATAYAHAPEVGERAWFTMTCREEAHETLIELAQTKGMSWVAHKLMRFTN